MVPVWLLGHVSFSLSPSLPICTMRVLSCLGPRKVKIKWGLTCPVPFWPKLHYLTHQPP